MPTILELIEQNQKKSRQLVLAFCSILFVLYCIVAAGLMYQTETLHRNSLYVIAIGGLIGATIHVAFVHVTMDKRIAKLAKTRAPNMTVRAEKIAYQVFEEVVLAARLKHKPKFEIMDANMINAFAYGYHEKDARICVTTRCLQVLNREELEGVIAHELAHVKNQDVKLQSVAVGVVASLVITGYIIMRIGGGSREKGGVLALAGLAFIIIGYPLAVLAMYALSREREYYADVMAARITRNPQGLAKALYRIYQEDQQPEIQQYSNEIPKELRALFIDDPIDQKTNAYATHPPLIKRIKRLDKTFTIKNKH